MGAMHPGSAPGSTVASVNHGTTQAWITNACPHCKGISKPSWGWTLLPSTATPALLPVLEVR